MTKSGNNARKQEARRIAQAEGISYTEALRRLLEERDGAAPIGLLHNDGPCPADCLSPCPPLREDLPPWEQPSCAIHQPDAHAGWWLGGSYPLTRIEFLTQGGENAPIGGMKLNEDSVTSVPVLAGFRAMLSAAAQRDFDRDWRLMHDDEYFGAELILALQQADEQVLAARVCAQEREAIRREFRITVGLDETDYDELAERIQPPSPDHLKEIEYLVGVRDTADAMLAMLLNHAGKSALGMYEGPLAALVDQEHLATADEVFSAAGWELTELVE